MCKLWMVQVYVQALCSIPEGPFDVTTAQHTSSHVHVRLYIILHVSLCSACVFAWVDTKRQQEMCAAQWQQHLVQRSFWFGMMQICPFSHCNKCLLSIARAATTPNYLIGTLTRTSKASMVVSAAAVIRYRCSTGSRSIQRMPPN